MKKLGLALSLATVAAITGCLDPQYKSNRSKVDTTTTTPSGVEPNIEDPVETVKPVDELTTIDVQVEPVPADNPEPVVEKPVAPKAEYTTYTVQRGDSLSKISKRYNIKLSAIRQSNPQVKNDFIKVGQKLQLPGKLTIVEQPAPAKTSSAKTQDAAKPAKSQSASKAYTGETKEYVVKNGDTLGAIAKASGITTAQLKNLNGLTKDFIRVGQKLKVPAAAKTTSEPTAKINKINPQPAKPVEKVDDQTTDDQLAVTPDPLGDASAVQPVAPTPTASTEQASFRYYEVREGDDILTISLNEDLSPTEIAELNSLPSDAVLTPGMKIKLPVK